MPDFPTLYISQLLELMPLLRKKRVLWVQDLLGWLNKSMEQGEINTPKRQAAFLAQLGHESLDLTRWVEMDHSSPVRGCPHCADFGTHRAGAQYEGRKDLGNTEPGDGERFKGRGPIQLTGRSNYREAGNALQLPLVQDPVLAEQLEVGFRVAVWFWNKHSLSTQADLGGPQAFDRITKRINGGHNGKGDRDIRYLNALKVLGA